MTALRLREVLPRDGFQDLDFIVPADLKALVIETLFAAGLDWIEVSSMVHPRRLPQFADAEDVVSRARRLEGLTVSVFVPNRRGLDRALAVGVDEVSLAVASTDSLSQSNFRMDATEALDEVLATTRTAISAGVDVSVTIGGAFGCPFDGGVPTERVVALAERIVASGVRTVFAADTIGSASPADVAGLFGELTAALPGVALGAHFHGGTRAVDNAGAAVEHGATLLDSALGGYGGCPFVPSAPGNVPTEAVAAWMAQVGLLGAPDPDSLLACAGRVTTMLNEGKTNVAAAAAQPNG